MEVRLTIWFKLVKKCKWCRSITDHNHSYSTKGKMWLRQHIQIATCTYISYLNRNCLHQFGEIPWNQNTDVHRGSGENVCWRHRNHVNAITSVIAAKQTVINEVYDFSMKLAIFNWNIHKLHLSLLIKLFWIIRIIDFNRTEPTCYRTIFPYTSSGTQNGAFWYIVLRVMLLMYTWGMIWFSNCDGLSRMWLHYQYHNALLLNHAVLW